VGELFDRAGLTHITASATNPDLSTHGWPFFRAVVTDEFQGKKIANVLAAIGCKKVAVIDDKGSYGKGLADFVAPRLKELGVEVVDREGIAAGTKDYGPLVDTIAAKSPDAVFYGGYYNDGSLILKQMRERGLTATFSSGDGSADRQLVTLAGAANAEGAILTCPCVIPAYATTPEAAKLQQDYKAKYSKDALIYSAEGFDAANIFVDAIVAAAADGKVTRPEILKFVQDLDGYKGVSRTYTFDETGELDETSRTINVYPVVAGSLKLIGTTEEVAPA
jgi:branched-chain amino acid transport system substrate-binding protein